MPVVGTDWTYTGKPGDSSRDTVRFLIGDILATDQLIGDSEIDYILTQQANVYLAAAMACEHLAAYYARQVDTHGQAGGKSFSQLMAHYTALADRIRGQASIITPMPYAGAIRISDIDANDADSDRPKSFFTSDQFDVL